MKNKILICLGLFCLLCAIGLTTYNLYEDHQADKNAVDVISQFSRNIEESNTDFTPNQMQTIKINGNEYIGTLDIPGLKLNTPILSKTSDKLLKIAPCCYSGSFLENNLVIGGHNYRSLFGKLHHTEVGMKVNFIDVYKNCYIYKIASIEILNPYDVDKLIKSNYDLSLFTCINGGTSRIVVRCIRN